MKYDPLYVQFLVYFNYRRDYYECHEALEELWLEEGRSPLYQGLLQIAVGLYHHLNGNVGGSIKLFTAGIDKLEHYPSDSLGIDLAALLHVSCEYLDKLKGWSETPFEFYDLTIHILDASLLTIVKQANEELELG